MELPTMGLSHNARIEGDLGTALHFARGCLFYAGPALASVKTQRILRFGTKTNSTFSKQAF